MAGALRARLGGSNTYAGETIAAPLMGAEFEPPTRAHARRAIQLVSMVTILGVVCGALFARSRGAR
jgi:cobalamin biosynthesis protein CobD/CbiB